MPILEEEKKKFFSFIDHILKEGKSQEFELTDMKTDGGMQFPSEAYLYVPDATKPSTWKLRVWETPESKVTVAQLGRAAAAFSSGGFRGNKVDIPADEMVSMKSKLTALYKKAGVGKDAIPQHIMMEEGGDSDMTDIKKLEDMEKRLQEIEDKSVAEKKLMDENYKKAFEDLEKKLADAHAKEIEATNKKLADAEVRLSEREKDLRSERVTKNCDGLVAKGFWPAVVNKVKAVMLSEVGDSTIKLEDKDVCLSDVLIDILNSIPEDARISFAEVGKTNKNVDPNKKFMTEKEVETYAKEKNMSFTEACSVLAKEGKIEI